MATETIEALPNAAINCISRDSGARILLNGREIARASSRQTANWTTGDSTGDIVITIPPRALKKANRLYDSGRESQIRNMVG